MTGHGIHVHRWRNEYIVPRAHPAPEAARSELDRLACHLPDELCAGLAAWVTAHPEPVVLLNRIIFECELDLSREGPLLVTRWAHRMARALIRAVELDGDGMLRFPSQAAFRAQFIADVAAGHAWHLWYYRSFEGVRALPVSSAIRTLLLEDAALGRATLAELAPQAWPRVAQAITRADALRILDGLSEESPAGGLSAVAVLLAAVERGLPAETTWFADALRLYAEALRAGSRPTRAAASLARLAARLWRLAAAGGASRLAAAVRAGATADLVAADPERDPDTWSALAAHPEWRPVLVALVHRAAAARPFPGASTRQQASTSFAGLALLLPEIDALLTQDVCRALPRSPAAQPRALAAWLSLAQCAGRHLASNVLGESFWRDFFGIPPGTGVDGILRWLDPVHAAPALAALARAAGALSRGRPMLTAFPAAGVRRRVLVDTSTGSWLAFGRHLSSDGVPWRECLAAARLARADWNNLATTWNLPGGWQDVFMQIAQTALRRFAYRIPGFAGSSVAYLHANFLASAGQWDVNTGELRLSRPPLHTLLQLTGVARSAISWSGPPARRLHPEYLS